MVTIKEKAIFHFLTSKYVFDGCISKIIKYLIHKAYFKGNI